MASSHTETRGLRLLSLDGGAIRGISILLIIQALMKHIQQREGLSELPKPCDFFDLIGGTNTGGIIAILLGRLRLDVEEAITRYQRLIERVYSDRKVPWSKELFKSKILRRELKLLVEEVTGAQDLLLVEEGTGSERCHVFVCSRNQRNLNANIPILFRSYPSTDSHGSRCTIWQAAHATCATPSVFKPAVVGNKQLFVDGGLGNSNPIRSVLSEAAKQFPGRMVTLVASIGTGHPQTIRISRPSALKATLMDMATDCEAKHNEMVEHFNQSKKLYFRFNVEQGMQTTKTLQVKHAAEVEAHTAVYIVQSEEKIYDAAAEIADGVGKIPVQYLVSAVGGLRASDALAALHSLDLTLHPKVAKQYEYQFQGKQECHRATRDEVLKKVDTWVRDPPTRTTQTSTCWWVTGIAGVGKSAIAMTTVECLLDRSDITAGDHVVTDIPPTKAPLLCAQYFFNHTLDSAKLSCFFPSLARQLADLSPVATSVIQVALKKQPSLLNRFGLEQAEQLFLNPFIEVAKLHAPKPVVVVIDGVDELQPPRGMSEQAAFVELSTVLGQLAWLLPANARLLILSRPVTQIIEHIPPHVHRFHLETKESRRDVDNLLRIELQKLGEMYSLKAFPTHSQHHRLCAVADGHLGWARQAIQWLADILEYEGRHGVDDVIGQIGYLATGDLDGLYSLICSRILPPEGNVRRAGYIAGLYQVLCALLALKTPQSIGTIAHLITYNLKNNNFNVLNCLKRLSIIYAVDTRSVTEDTVPRAHKSFHDFLVSSVDRAGDFSIDLRSAHSELARACFGLMQSEELHFNMGRVSQQKSEGLTRPDKHVEYACSSFFHHVELSREDFAVEVERWMSTKFLFWLEVQILLLSGDMSGQQDNMRALQSRCITRWQSKTLGALVGTGHDLITILQNQQPEGARYRPNFTALYMTILPFSPLVIQSLSPTFHITTNSPLHDWSSASDYPCSISRNGRLVAILCNELCILSTDTGRVQWQSKAIPHWNNSGVVFSPNGNTVAITTLLVSPDGSLTVDVIFFDCSSGDQVQQFNLTLATILPATDSAFITNFCISPMNTFVAFVLKVSGVSLPYQQAHVFRVSDQKCLWHARTLGPCVQFINEKHLIIQEVWL